MVCVSWAAYPRYPGGVSWRRRMLCIMGILDHPSAFQLVSFLCFSWFHYAFQFVSVCFSLFYFAFQFVSVGRRARAGSAFILFRCLISLAIYLVVLSRWGIYFNRHAAISLFFFVSQCCSFLAWLGRNVPCGNIKTVHPR